MIVIFRRLLEAGPGRPEWVGPATQRLLESAGQGGVL